MNNKKNWYISVHWAGCISIFMAQIVSMNVLAEKDEHEKLSVAFSIEFLENKTIVVEIDNPTDTDQHVKTNLAQVLDSSFLKFPTRAALQFRDTTGKKISFRGEKADGWGYPSRYFSSAEIGNIVEQSDLIVPKNRTLTFPLKNGDILQLATSNRLGDNKKPIKDFRMRLPLSVSVASGKSFSITVISEWLPFPERRNDSP